MANFLTKLFRRKGGTSEEKKAKKSKKAPKSSRAKSAAVSEKATEKASPIPHEDPLNRSPTATTAPPSDRSAGRQSSDRVLSPRNIHPEVSKQQNRRGERGPVDLDETDVEESDENRDRSNLSPRLSFQQLQQFNRQQPVNGQQQPSNGQNTLYVLSPTKDSRKFRDGHAAAMDDTANGSDCSSSDFNLSTDAEDTEYNNLRRRGGAPYMNSPNLDTSGISQMSSPTAYTTDDDNAIFPALQTDDDATTTKEDSVLPEDDIMKIVPMAHETEDDIRAWTVSPSSQSQSQSLKGSEGPTSPTFNSYKGAASKKETKAVETKSTNLKDTFGDFANFDDVSFPMEQPKKDSRRLNTRSFLVDAPDKSPDGFASQRRSRGISSSASAAHPEMSLTDLLAQAKRKSSRNKKGSSSVNSAPVITAQYLREHHKLRSSNGDSRSVDKTTSVSDIIRSLEATNDSRIKSSSRSTRSKGDHDTRSHTSNGGTSTRSAKERIRAKRRQERNRIGSDESDNEEAESWLFDEVTGALGPRGVAADMESLGGKSNRSKNSSGNKSHRSHRSHKSHRSHRSHRRKKSSNESVDSRNSRNSRNSRYSHRSTRSYLSQMSEQSRSVANDLLRLEMQLAMVGSQEVNGDENVKGGGSVTGSIGGASRASRTSRTSRQSRTTSRSSTTVTKRSKMTVVAPPGKLGIILANKADSKGTVVSGVRTSSVLAEKISPGDRIIAIDGEDVSLMTVSEITTIMARKSDFERQLTVMTTPKHLGLTSSSNHHSSHNSSRDYGTAESDAYYRR